MATTPVQNPPRVPPPETVEQRFRRLEAQWMADTEFLSDAGKIVAHPAFQAIVALGADVVPLMLYDLESRPSLWVWALPQITGANPVAATDGGKIRKMTEAWLKWGREKGLL
jgi:hypothetical protein